MESAVCVSGFLLLLCSTGVTLSPDPKLRFGHEGGNVSFYPGFSSVDDYVLYKVSGDGNLLLLINCSQTERPQPQVECVNDTSIYFKMSNLTMSHSGDYRAESWIGGNFTEHRSFHLTVCAEEGEWSNLKVFYGDSVELFSLNSPLGHGSSLELYRYDWRLDNYILVLDTNSSPEPLVEDLKGRLQVDLNKASLTLYGVTFRDSNFYCAVWRGVQCKSCSYRKLDIETNIVFAHEKENVTLSCIAIRELSDQMYWAKENEHDQFIIIINQTHPQEVMYNQTHLQEVMYMLNGSQSGDYSLIIPSVTLQHAGRYECGGNELLKQTIVYICTKLSPLDVMFSPGQSVHLNITSHLIASFVYGIQWYHQRVLQPQVLIVDIHSHNYRTPVSLPEDLRGRVTSPSNSSLIISNFTAEDSGLYTWRVYGGRAEGWEDKSDLPCYEGSFRLVYLDPSGVHSLFYRAYASLMGCGLLGLVTTVIWFKLRSRREQTSGRQSREGMQSGDEDLYEEVEMTELNTPPSAMSDGAAC